MASSSCSCCWRWRRRSLRLSCRAFSVSCTRSSFFFFSQYRLMHTPEHTIVIISSGPPTNEPTRITVRVVMQHSSSGSVFSVTVLGVQHPPMSQYLLTTNPPYVAEQVSPPLQTETIQAKFCLIQQASSLRG